MWSAAGDLTADAARQAISSEWFDRLARFGYACKGVVFGAVGVLAAAAAGLIAFGAYSVMLAVHRDIRNAEAVDEA